MTRFSQATRENAVSRTYVGYHFRSTVFSGIGHGQRIANRAVNTALRAIHH